ncbi:M23 family metallopeptidase [Thioclava sp. FR2]|uniref:M23 family metallopeptidase n=1 Tax=Thioclava sp. FR2 TaxID=3445780 RepID=UPI003EB7A6CA
MIRTVLVLMLAPASAGAFSMEWPIDCTLEETCHIQQYMDRDPSTTFADFTCGPLSYDTHRGTDIALSSLAAMRKGVMVRAAASGVVKGLRDGMEDISIRATNAPKIEGRECGNGLVIDHGDGWETQYCHMAKGSLRHSVGAKITAGEGLGLVGLSGNTEFPHLHVSVRHNGIEIDPFDPDGAAKCGEGPEAPLWSDPIPYQPGGLIAIGLSDAVPSWEAIKESLPIPTPDRNAPALVLWVHYFGNHAGDTLRLTLTGPSGRTLFTEDVILERTQAQGFRAVGRKQRQAIPAGDYSISAVLLRGGIEIDQRATSVPRR